MDQCRIARQGPYATVADQEPLLAQSRNAGAAGDDKPTVEEAAATDSTLDAAASKEKEIKQQIDDLVQSQGDTSLYWYYFKSIGWKYGLVSLSFATSMEVFVVMGGTFSPFLIRRKPSKIVVLTCQ